MRVKRQAHNTTLFLATSLLLTSLACLGFGAKDRPSDAAQQSQPSGESGGFDYQGLGLETLDTYATRFEASFTLAGESSPLWTYALDTLDSHSGLRRTLVIEGAAPGADLGDTILTRVADTQYMTGQGLGNELCFIFPASLELETSLLAPDDLLEPSQLAVTRMGAGQETSVGGRAGTRYTFEADALGPYTSASGELVVSPEGAFVLRYEFAGDTADTPLTQGQPGRLKWHYELTTLNPTEEVNVPEACVIDVPVMPDAFDLSRLPGLIAYQSPSPAGDVVVFYEMEMVAAGWAVAGPPASGGSTTLLSFSRSAQVADISVASNADGSEVQVFLDE